MLNRPNIKDNISAFDLVFKLKPTIIGMVGMMQGDNIEATPVKNEIIGIIPILKSPFNQILITDIFQMRQIFLWRFKTINST